jgi:hypothetical protein
VVRTIDGALQPGDSPSPDLSAVPQTYSQVAQVSPREGRPFWVDQVEHKNCANPTLETSYQLSQRFMAELPFDAPMTEEELPIVDGSIYPSYGDVHQEKIQ